MEACRKRTILRGEIALLTALVINSFGVALMLYSGSGISAISSVPYALTGVLPALSLGTWTYLFQGVLVLSLMLLRRQIVVSYLFSFAVGFCFGKLLDVQELWIHALPKTLPLQVVYFMVSYTGRSALESPSPTAAKCPLFRRICFRGSSLPSREPRMGGSKYPST